MSFSSLLGPWLGLHWQARENLKKQQLFLAETKTAGY